MNIIKDTTDFKIPEQTAVAIGKFDGLHLGHKALLDRLARARESGLKSAVFTFDPSPGIYFSALRGSETYRELMTVEEKRESFEALGIDYLVEYPFRAETAAVPPAKYIKKYILDQMNASLIVAGEDVSFGKGGAGNADLIKEILKKRGLDPDERVIIIPKVVRNGKEISSTLVRSMVEHGNMEEASQLLGEDYCIRGVVKHGNHIGRTLGMPTANLYPPDKKLLPPRGVYFSTVRIKGDPATYRSITNIGLRPTIHSDDPKINVETYIFDFDRDIYDEQIDVRLVHFHRHEQRFEGLEELKKQMHSDCVLAGGQLLNM